MGQRVGKRREQSHDPTSIAPLAAFLGGVGVLSYGESLLGDLQDSGGLHAQALADWQVHMGASCMGAAALVVILYLLELLGRQSKIIAWRSSWPWLPLVGLTALATVIHIPAFAVIVMCVLDAAWASYRTRTARGTSNTKGNITNSKK
jgi:hypothetical protein